ncbi:unnamed protein product [Ambrosiozyma monospora]|uniref:Unnamed protein product n=1 Tax=Ambrosiozyma monospora TaxID=43982 RepID=A0ACB5U9E3_AMBMO|nr:unnamed protein product [Ambrosiozyma monospora]
MKLSYISTLAVALLSSFSSNVEAAPTPKADQDLTSPGRTPIKLKLYVRSTENIDINGYALGGRQYSDSIDYLFLGRAGAQPMVYNPNTHQLYNDERGYRMYFNTLTPFVQLANYAPVPEQVILLVTQRPNTN